MRHSRAPFKTVSLGRDTFGIDRRRVLKAMDEFDRHCRGKEPESGTRFAVFHNGRQYPPKRVLRLAIGRPVSMFSGGKQTNEVFTSLGFEITRPSAPPRQREDRIRRPIPKVQEVVSSLFSQKWAKLFLEGSVSYRLEDSRYPGVYVLAYSDEKLEGKRVDENTIFYVGMSNHASLEGRLKQFTDAIEGHGSHSAGERFFKKVARGTPYSRFKLRKEFFVAAAGVACITNKTKRTPRDLRKMGVIAACELYVLARVKEKNAGREPELNKQ